MIADYSFVAKLLLSIPCISDRVQIQLKNNMETPSPCHGEIYVNVNGSLNAVCSKDTTTYMKIAEVVCRELQCGIALTVVNGFLIKEGQISLFGCNGQEKSLWECRHKYEKVVSCQTINIVCSGNCSASNSIDQIAEILCNSFQKLEQFEQ